MIREDVNEPRIRKMLRPRDGHLACRRGCRAAGRLALAAVFVAVTVAAPAPAGAARAAERAARAPATVPAARAAERAAPAGWVLTCGDIDGDRGVNTVDAYHVLRVAVGLTPGLDLLVADVDADGMVGLRDALRILRFAVMGEPPLGCPVTVVFSVHNETRLNALMMKIRDTGYVVTIDDGEAVLHCADVFGNDGAGGFGFAEYDFQTHKVHYAVVRNLPANAPVDVMRCLVRPDFTFNEDDVLLLDALVWELDAAEPKAPAVWPDIAVRWE